MQEPTRSWWKATPYPEFVGMTTKERRRIWTRACLRSFLWWQLWVVMAGLYVLSGLFLRSWSYWVHAIFVGISAQVLAVVLTELARSESRRIIAEERGLKGRGRGFPSMRSWVNRLVDRFKFLWSRLQGWRSMDVSDLPPEILDQLAHHITQDAAECRVKSRLVRRLAGEHFPEAGSHIIIALSDGALRALLEGERLRFKQQYVQVPDEDSSLSVPDRIARELTADLLLDPLPQDRIASFAQAAAWVTGLPEYIEEYLAEKKLLNRHRTI